MSLKSILGDADVKKERSAKLDKLELRAPKKPVGKGEGKPVVKKPTTGDVRKRLSKSNKLSNSGKSVLAKRPATKKAKVKSILSGGNNKRSAKRASKSVAVTKEKTKNIQQKILIALFAAKRPLRATSDTPSYRLIAEDLKLVRQTPYHWVHVTSGVPLLYCRQVANYLKVPVYLLNWKAFKVLLGDYMPSWKSVVSDLKKNEKFQSGIFKGLAATEPA